MSVVSQDGRVRRRWLASFPLMIFAGLAALFMLRLGSGDPSKVPSALIGKPAPATELPPIEGLTRDGQAVPGLSAESLKGEVTIVNVWASWCAPCHEEAPLLDQLSQQARVRLAGINYKDQPENARRFLGRYGNPFFAVGADASGRASIEWGVYGVPETFVLDRNGMIVFKLVGPITAQNLTSTLMPAIERARRPAS
jgi:cytochrome c biogenesis protein CcmG, thiol:disulfide interchange protein DsbE